MYSPSELSAGNGTVETVSPHASPVPPPLREALTGTDSEAIIAVQTEIEIGNLVGTAVTRFSNSIERLMTRCGGSFEQYFYMSKSDLEDAVAQHVSRQLDVNQTFTEGIADVNRLVREAFLSFAPVIS